MAVAPRVDFNDGELITPADLVSLQKNIAFFLQNDLLYQLFGNVEYGSTQPPTGATSAHAAGLDDDRLAALGDGSYPADKGNGAVRSFGFVGQSFRVIRVNATTMRVFPGIGLQYATSGVPAGESALRVVRMAALRDFVIAVALGAGNYRRDLVCVKWNDKSTSASVQMMDADGIVSTSSQPKRVEPEVSDTVPTIQVVTGVTAGSAAAAARPAVPAGYVAIAEALVSDAGLVNAANVDGSTPGLVDLRPRLIAHKAMGFAAHRRATCSMDETTAVRDARRIGAKAVGEDVVRGFVQIPTSVGAVTLDTSRDWRDQMIEIKHSLLLATALLPGGGSDDSLQLNSSPVTGSAGLADVVFFSGAGSVDGTGGYYSAASKTAADGSTTSITFFADSTTGALKCRGLADAAGTQQMYFRAAGFGPLGKRPPTGVEA